MQLIKKPKRVPEGFHRIFLSLSCISALILFGCAVYGCYSIFAEYTDGFHPIPLEEAYSLVMAFIIGAIPSFYATYYILAVIPLFIRWIVDGFTQ